MCIIMLVEDKRPSHEMLDRAWARNCDGAGLAWREKNKDDKAVVHWKKGIDDFDEMEKMVNELPTPLVLHLRLTSVGGTRPSLCHPFPIAKNVPTSLEGRFPGWVLFHNGTWEHWDKIALEAAIRSNTEIPDGKWNDTRALAFMTSIYGHGFMELIQDQRGILFGPGPKDVKMITGKPWVRINDILCSNDDYLTKGPRFTVCRENYCHKRDRLDREGFCGVHSSIEAFREAEKKVETPVRTGALGVTPTTERPGVAQGNQTPFRHPIQPLLTLALAKELHQKGVLSRNKYKDVQKWWGRIHNQGKSGQKAHEKLMALSIKLATRDQHQKVH